jgi:hypothetical protein
MRRVLIVLGLVLLGVGWMLSQARPPKMLGVVVAPEQVEIVCRARGQQVVAIEQGLYLCPRQPPIDDPNR